MVIFHSYVKLPDGTESCGCCLIISPLFFGAAVLSIISQFPSWNRLFHLIFDVLGAVWGSEKTTQTRQATEIPDEAPCSSALDSQPAPNPAAPRIPTMAMDRFCWSHHTLWFDVVWSFSDTFPWNRSLIRVNSHQFLGFIKLTNPTFGWKGIHAWLAPQNFATTAVTSALQHLGNQHFQHLLGVVRGNGRHLKAFV